MFVHYEFILLKSIEWSYLTEFSASHFTKHFVKKSKLLIFLFILLTCIFFKYYTEIELSHK